jgi:SepF-like predicted cell division protein (DUF552 family)
VRNITLTNLLNDTLYFFNVTSCDISGNCNTTGPFNFTTMNNTVDVTPPAMTLSVPLDAATITTDSVAFGFTATDDTASVLVCNLTINGAINVTGINAPNGVPTSVTVGGFTDGTYTWNVTCTDGTNANTSDTRSFDVSITTAPPTPPTGGGPSYTPPAVNVTPPACTPNWQCVDVGACFSGLQKRDCVDLNNCGNTLSQPPLMVLCTVPQPIPPVVATPEVEKPTPSSMIETPSVIEAPLRIEEWAQDISIAAMTLLIGLTIAALLCAASYAGALLLMRRKEEEEDFYGLEAGHDKTTYVPYASVVEAQEILEKLLNGDKLKGHAPFLVNVCRHSLDEARGHLASGKMPQQRAAIEGHVDWITMIELCRVVRVMAAAMLASVPVRVENKGHEHVWSFGTAVDEPREEYPEVKAETALPSKAGIHKFTLSTRSDAHAAVDLLRDGTNLLLIDLAIKDNDDAKAVLKLLKRTATINKGEIVSLGGKLYMVTSDMRIERNAGGENDGTE